MRAEQTPEYGLKEPKKSHKSDLLGPGMIIIVYISI
jgi:hypothetical protein